MADIYITRYLHEQWISTVSDPKTVIFKTTKRKKKDKQRLDDTRVFNDYMKALWCGEFNPPKSEEVLSQHISGYVGFKPLCEILEYIDR